ncbi:MAG: hypothetical protein ACI4HJ_04925 [Ruminococcus sp.]
MAKKRMYDKEIVGSDAFIEMPTSSQALYFHLGMNADDDGFVGNPKSIQRQIGASDDDMRLLIMKRFIYAFDSGVVLIKHWNINNFIRKDRYKPTTYIKEKSLIVLCDNNSYRITTVNRDFTMVNQRSTQYSIEEYSKEKCSLVEESVDSDLSRRISDKTAALYQPIRIEELCPHESDLAPQERPAANKAVKSKSAEEKHCFGEFNNVYLTDKEYKELVSQFGAAKALAKINRLSRWLYSDSSHIKTDHYRTILVWHSEDKAKKLNKAEAERANASYDIDKYEKYSMFD